MGAFLLLTQHNSAAGSVDVGRNSVNISHRPSRHVRAHKPWRQLFFLVKLEEATGGSFAIRLPAPKSAEIFLTMLKAPAGVFSVKSTASCTVAKLSSSYGSQNAKLKLLACAS